MPCFDEVVFSTSDTGVLKFQTTLCSYEYTFYTGGVEQSTRSNFYVEIKANRVGVSVLVLTVKLNSAFTGSLSMYVVQKQMRL